jgi:hypothetical protein
LACRPEQARNYIQNNFNLPQQVDVALDVFPANAGQIKISTITPDNYPWQGVYFDGIPIQIEAIANPGFVFSHWEANGIITDVLDPKFLDTLATSNVQFKAFFTSTAGFNELQPSYLSIYPNPANNLINISATSQLGPLDLFKIVDILGKSQTVKSTNSGIGEWLIDVSHLEPGFYFLNYCEIGGRSYKTPFIKQ